MLKNILIGHRFHESLSVTKLYRKDFLDEKIDKKQDETINKFIAQNTENLNKIRIQFMMLPNCNTRIFIFMQYLL